MSDRLNGRLNKLIEGVADKTERNELTWQAFNDESFHVLVGPGAIHLQRDLRQGEDDDGVHVPYTRYEIQLADGKGRVFDEAGVNTGDVDFPLLDRLFRAARNQALGGDRVIRDMLNAIGYSGE